jgi:hypothetical protein
VAIDDRGQVFPRRRKSQWGEYASSDIVDGKPVAKIILAKAGKTHDILVSEAKGAYDAKLDFARRAVVFNRKYKYFLVIDRIQATDAPHKFTSYWHFNNRDGKGTLTGSGDDWLFSRPKANLKINASANTPMACFTSDGYMHELALKSQKCPKNGPKGQSHLSLGHRPRKLDTL